MKLRVGLLLLLFSMPTLSAKALGDDLDPMGPADGSLDGKLAPKSERQGIDRCDTLYNQADRQEIKDYDTAVAVWNCTASGLLMTPHGLVNGAINSTINAGAKAASSVGRSVANSAPAVGKAVSNAASKGFRGLRNHFSSAGAVSLDNRNVQPSSVQKSSFNVYDKMIENAENKISAAELKLEKAKSDWVNSGKRLDGIKFDNLKLAEKDLAQLKAAKNEAIRHKIVEERIGRLSDAKFDSPQDRSFLKMREAELDLEKKYSYDLKKDKIFEFYRKKNILNELIKEQEKIKSAGNKSFFSRLTQSSSSEKDIARKIAAAEKELVNLKLDLKYLDALPEGEKLNLNDIDNKEVRNKLEKFEKAKKDFASFSDSYDREVVPEDKAKLKADLDKAQANLEKARKELSPKIEAQKAVDLAEIEKGKSDLKKNSALSASSPSNIEKLEGDVIEKKRNIEANFQKQIGEMEQKLRVTDKEITRQLERVKIAEGELKEYKKTFEVAKSKKYYKAMKFFEQEKLKAESNLKEQKLRLEALQDIHDHPINALDETRKELLRQKELALQRVHDAAQTFREELKTNLSRPLLEAENKAKDAFRTIGIDSQSGQNIPDNKLTDEAKKSKIRLDDEFREIAIDDKVRNLNNKIYVELPGEQKTIENKIKAAKSEIGRLKELGELDSGGKSALRELNEIVRKEEMKLAQLNETKAATKIELNQHKLGLVRDSLETKINASIDELQRTPRPNPEGRIALEKKIQLNQEKLAQFADDSKNLADAKYAQAELKQARFNRIIEDLAPKERAVVESSSLETKTQLADDLRKAELERDIATREKSKIFAEKEIRTIETGLKEKGILRLNGDELPNAPKSGLDSDLLKVRDLDKANIENLKSDIDKLKVKLAEPPVQPQAVDQTAGMKTKKAYLLEIEKRNLDNIIKQRTDFRNKLYNGVIEHPEGTPKRKAIDDRIEKFNKNIEELTKKGTQLEKDLKALKDAESAIPKDIAKIEKASLEAQKSLAVLDRDLSRPLSIDNEVRVRQEAFQKALPKALPETDADKATRKEQVKKFLNNEIELRNKDLGRGTEEEWYNKSKKVALLDSEIELRDRKVKLQEAILEGDPVKTKSAASEVVRSQALVESFEPAKKPPVAANPAAAANPVAPVDPVRAAANPAVGGNPAGAEGQNLRNRIYTAVDDAYKGVKNRLPEQIKSRLPAGIGLPNNPLETAKNTVTNSATRAMEAAQDAAAARAPQALNAVKSAGSTAAQGAKVVANEAAVLMKSATVGQVGRVATGAALGAAVGGGAALVTGGSAATVGKAALGGAVLGGAAGALTDNKVAGRFLGSIKGAVAPSMPELGKVGGIPEPALPRANGGFGELKHPDWMMCLMAGIFIFQSKQRIEALKNLMEKREVTRNQINDLFSNNGVFNVNSSPTPTSIPIPTSTPPPTSTPTPPPTSTPTPTPTSTSTPTPTPTETNSEDTNTRGNEKNINPYGKTNRVYSALNSISDCSATDCSAVISGAEKLMTGPERALVAAAGGVENLLNSLPASPEEILSKAEHGGVAAALAHAVPPSGPFGAALNQLLDVVDEEGDRMGEILGKDALTTDAELQKLISSGGSGFSNGSHRSSDSSSFASLGVNSSTMPSVIEIPSAFRKPAAVETGPDIWHKGTDLNLFQIVSTTVKKVTPRVMVY